MSTIVALQGHGSDQHGPGQPDDLSGVYLASQVGQTAHAPGLGLWFPEAEGAAGDGTTDDTTAVQAALDAAGVAAAAAAALIADDQATRGMHVTVYISPGKAYVTSGVTVPSMVKVTGGGALIHKAGSGDHLVQLADADTHSVWLDGISLYGQSGSQTSAVDGIHFDNSTAASISLNPTHRITNVHVAYVKGVGIYLSYNTRRTFVDRCSVYYADSYGMNLEGADSMISNVDVGQSGVTGVRVAGTGYLLSQVKSWFSGRIDNVGNGFLIFGDSMSLSNCWSQDNMGHGFQVFRSGHTITGLQMDNCVSDNDNAALTTFGGFSLSNVSKAMIRGQVRTFTGGRNGVPVYGLNLAGGTTGCDIRLSVSGTSSFEVQTSTDNKNNHIEVNGREGVVVSSTAGTYTFNALAAETHFIAPAGNMTISNPSRKPGGMRLRFVVTNNGTPGHTITFGSDFKTNWTPDTGANKTNIAEFISDGTFWWQTSAVTGI